MLRFSSYISRLTAVILLLAIASSAEASRQSKAERLYAKWATMPNLQLLQKGVALLSGTAKTDSALVCFNIIANRLEHDSSPSDADMKIYISALYNLGYLYSMYYYDFPQAYTYLEKALTLSDENDKDFTTPYIYNTMAHLSLMDSEMHGYKQSPTEAISLFSHAYHAAAKTADWPVLFVTLNNMVALGVKYNCISKIEPELAHFTRLKVPKEQVMLPYMRTVVQATRRFGARQYDQAARLFDMSVGMVQSEYERTARFGAISTYNKAIALMKMGHHSQAIAIFTQMERQGLEQDATDLLADVRQMLQQCYTLQGDTAMANSYYIAYLKDRDAMLSGNRLEDVRRMRFAAQLSDVNNKLKAMEYERKTHTVIMAGVGMLAIVVTLFLILLTYKNKRLKNSYQTLFDSNIRVLDADRQKRIMIESYEKLIESKDAIIEQMVWQQHDSIASGCPDKEKYKGSHLSQEDKDVLVGKIDSVMANTTAICSERFSLNALADTTGSNIRYVSQVINEIYGKSFSALLADYRIREACRLLNSRETSTQLTIEGIARTVGFSSRSHFATVFKKQTGLSPSEYIRQSRQRNA